MELESSSPYPQVPATCPYPEPTPSSPLVFNVYWFLTRQKAASLWSIPLTSIYCWGYEWLELYLYLSCMPVCVNSCWDILKHWKQQCVQMPQQLMVFMKNIFDIHYKNTVGWLEQIAACFSSWRVGFNSRVDYLGVVVDEVARELGLSSEHFYSVNALHDRTCNLRDIQLPHYTPHFKRYCPNLL
jgi:hypothetical protein